MKPFLEHVAEDLLAKHGSDLSRLTVVFPNKRASLFLNAHLARLSDRPLWSPHDITISELFRQQSSRTLADPIKLVCELHKSFTAQTGIDETLDHFYGWGQLLLSDFDDLDKCMADADQVLANLQDLHELDGTDFLTEEQKIALQKFFSTFSTEHTSLLRERFLRLWSHMADIYHDFNDRLSRQGLAYEGALYREVVETINNKQLTINNNGQYVFVGFNVLQQVEQKLFTYLKREGLARFYWDFDEYYKESEAGMFIAQNLQLFPNELDSKDESIYSCFAHPKDIAIASAPTENIQARYAAQWLAPTNIPPEGEGTPLPSGERLGVGLPDTAIVLCDEKLLPTVIHCLPDGIEQVNVTTGYPLSQAPVASLIATLFALRTQGYHPGRDRYRLRQVNALLRHPYIADLSPQVSELQRELNETKNYHPTPSQLCTDETTTLLFHSVDSLDNAALLGWMTDVLKAVATHSPAPDETFNINAESLFRAYTLLNRVLTLVTAGDLQVDVITLQRLVSQLIQATTIPFHGEPAQGLQVMGLLETRCLDFSHVLLLSANEGNIPRGVNDTSFIPYTLRKAYGLTTADHKVAIYSYYFHRLLQRADDVTILYNNATNDGHTGEMSRFVLQLMVEDQHHHIATHKLQAPQAFIPFRPQAVEKTPEMMEKLLAHFTSVGGDLQSPTPLTPSAINRYQRCPLQFYYTYVHDLREPDDTDDDTIDNRIFGNIFHEAARIVYTRLMEKSRRIVASDLEQLLRKKVDIEMAVDEAIRQELFHLDSGRTPDLSGLQLINREVIIHYLRQLLAIDMRLAPFTIIGLETDVTMPLTIKGDLQSYAGGDLQSPTLNIGGRIDRLDCIVKDGREQLRVIDYKTGSRVPSPLSGVEAIFQQDQLKNHNDYYLQTFLYSIIVAQQTSNLSAGGDLQSPTTSAGGDLQSPTTTSNLTSQFPTVAPALLFIQHAGADDYNPVLKFGKEHINDVAPYAEQFMSLLTPLIGEIFDAATPFHPTADRTRCTNCPFRLLCQ